ncbi:MAG: 30S ribosomal protein S15 [Candidatus Colwellbacteria bacterium]|nr:30S ribosomal protein S15 [Candidatus Colwellbacteria bacterium]
MLTTKKKKIVIKESQAHEKDTGSASVQVSLLSKRIDELADHLKAHSKDKHSRRGLVKMVSQRRKLLKYLSTNSPKAHSNLVKRLGLKK